MTPERMKDIERRVRSGWAEVAEAYREDVAALLTALREVQEEKDKLGWRLTQQLAQIQILAEGDEANIDRRDALQQQLREAIHQAGGYHETRRERGLP